MLIAQLSDLHLRAHPPAGARVDTLALLRACLDDLTRRDPAPDLLLLTGDLSDAGSAADYELLRTLLEPLHLPVLLLAGNHDDRSALRRIFSGDAHAHLQQHPVFVQYVVEQQGLRLIALDTVVSGQPHGELCEQRLQWLAQTLAASATPTVLAMHHPPFDTGLHEMDGMGLRHGAAELEALLLRHPQVQAVLCGHLHRCVHTRFAHTVALTAPSTAHQIALELRPAEPTRYVLEPPGYLLHRWQGGRLVSHALVVGDFGGPQDFDTC